MGNGQKAQMRRERNAKGAGKDAKSQLKVNDAAKNIVCKKCFQTFLTTASEKLLSEHASNKHNMTVKESFPDWSPKK